jgi:hypothetical protein
MAHRLLVLSAHVDSDLLRAAILPQVILHRFLDFDGELFAFTAFKAALIRKRMRLLMSVATLAGVPIQLASLRCIPAVRRSCFVYIRLYASVQCCSILF